MEIGFYRGLELDVISWGTSDKLLSLERMMTVVGGRNVASYVQIYSSRTATVTSKTIRRHIEAALWYHATYSTMNNLPLSLNPNELTHDILADLKDRKCATTASISGDVWLNKNGTINSFELMLDPTR